jgi:hypothetical protein
MNILVRLALGLGKCPLTDEQQVYLKQVLKATEDLHPVEQALNIVHIQKTIGKDLVIEFNYLDALFYSMASLDEHADSVLFQDKLEIISHAFTKAELPEIVIRPAYTNFVEYYGIATEQFVKLSQCIEKGLYDEFLEMYNKQYYDKISMGSLKRVINSREDVIEEGLHKDYEGLYRFETLMTKVVNNTYKTPEQ